MTRIATRHPKAWAGARHAVLTALTPCEIESTIDELREHGDADSFTVAPEGVSALKAARAITQEAYRALAEIQQDQPGKAKAIYGHLMFSITKIMAELT